MKVIASTYPLPILPFIFGTFIILGHSINTQKNQCTCGYLLFQHQHSTIYSIWLICCVICRVLLLNWIKLKGRVIKEKMFTCIACTKQTSDERDEDGRESGTPNTKEAVKSLTTQVLTLFLLSPHFLLF
jgi:hypothetical protein